VTVNGGWVSVEVTDEGRGYDASSVPAGNGLAGSIRRRLTDVGDAASVRS
jgi:signal transduction histidine kinase